MNNDTQLTTIELFKEYLEFSAGHFTIFSATRREKMHGHNFNVYAAITAEMTSNGMAFDYAIYKIKLADICEKLNGYFLLASQSPYMQLKEEGDYYYCHFNKEKIPFLKEDVIVLPLRNITIEELANWFIDQLVADKTELDKHLIAAITVKIFSSPGQCASASWERTDA